MAILGRNQRSCLRSLAEYNNGEWQPGCGWHWDGVGTTDRILNSLVKHKLVERYADDRHGCGRYRITEAGRKLATHPSVIKEWESTATRKQHPADAAAAADITQAEHFRASLFLGTGRWAKSQPYRNLEGARHHARQMEQRDGGSRRALIYATLPDGREVPVPDNYPGSVSGASQPTAKEDEMPVKTYTKKQNAHRAARKALGGHSQGGVDYELYEAKPGAWAWRAKGAAAGAAVHVETGSGEGRKAPKKAAGKKAARKEPRQPKPKKLGKRAQAEADAKEGKLPEPPDFTAETHKRYRGKLDEVRALVKAGDVAGLRAYPIKPISTSPKALDRYRNLAVIALEAREEKKAA